MSPRLRARGSARCSTSDLRHDHSDPVVLTVHDEQSSIVERDALRTVEARGCRRPAVFKEAADRAQPGVSGDHAGGVDLPNTVVLPIAEVETTVGAEGAAI